MMSGVSLRVSRTMHASPERIFEAWTEPVQLAMWWRMDEPGWALAGATVDLRVGGAYRLAMTAPDGQTHAAVGIFRDIRRPSRLVFTWDWEAETSRVGPTRVTVEILDRGGGLTEVVVVHEAFADPERVPGHERGWTQLLLRLERTVAREGREMEDVS